MANHLWHCPQGLHPAVRAPARMRLDDARRLCPDCTAATGRLVKRRCPALEVERAAKRARAAERQKAQRAKASAKSEAKYMVGTMDVREELAWLVRFFELQRTPELIMQRTKGRSSRGRAQYGSRAWPGYVKIRLGRWESPDSCVAWVWETLAHEVIHSFGLRHGPEMVAEIDRVCLARWGVDVKNTTLWQSKGRIGTKKNYEFDRLATAAIATAVQREYTDPPRVVPEPSLPPQVVQGTVAA